MPLSSETLPRRSLIVLLLILAIIWFGSLDQRKLIKPDEGRYAEISREMAVSGDWLTPRLNDLKYFEKPPLQYWATAAAYEAFGTHEWTARLWTALTGFFGILLTAWTAAKLYGPRTGVIAGAILASSALYVLLGHINALDMALSFFMASTLFCTLLARHSEEPRAQRRWMLATWAAMALAVLSKGLIGIVLPGAVLVLYVILSRDWALIKMLEWLHGPLLFFLIAAPWFVWVSIQNPEFPHFFFIHEHFERFLTTGHQRVGAWWYFLPILFSGCLPWLTMLPSALISSLVRPAPLTLSSSNRGFKPELMLLVWAVFIFVFFSASSSKLPAYILPIFPALAILFARSVASLNRKQLLIHLALLAVLALAALIIVFKLPELRQFRNPSPTYLAYREWLIFCFAGWLLGIALSIVLAWRNQTTAAILGLALISLLTWTSVLLGHEQLRGTTSSYELSHAVIPEIEKAGAPTPFYSIGMYDQTMNFYLGRTVTLVIHRDELDFGLQQEPLKWVPDLPTFEQRWRSDAQAFAIMAPEVFATLQELALPMRVIFKDQNRVVIAKR